MESILLIVLGVMVVGFGVVIFVLNQRLGDMRQGGAVELMKADLVELTRNVAGLQQVMGDKLEKNASTMQLSLQKQLSESAKLVTDVTQRLAKLDETNRRVVDVVDELKTLQNVLQNPKQRGVFGEYYLQSVLENVLPPGQYEMQYKFNNGDIADAVIFLERGQILSIDSKFSLENYNRMIEATDKLERERLLLKVKADLKGRIDETSKYIRPSENTMDF